MVCGKDSNNVSLKVRKASYWAMKVTSSFGKQRSKPS